MSTTASAALLGVALAGLALPAVSATASTPAATPTIQAACSAAPAGHARCQALRYVPVNGGKGALAAPAAPSGLSPANIQAAYQLPSAGSGVTVAIVDAYDDPNAASDLATYRSQYGLPACTTANGCFKKVNQTGGSTPPSGDTGWGAEITLDLDAVSAACPACKILLVEANDNNDPNLYAAVDEAVALGAKFVSNSYSSAEDSSETGYDSHFNVPGVLFAFATGDNGYSAGTQYPAASRYALAVGGTSLKTASNTRGWSETVWNGAGSGCSAYEAQPTWQKNVVTACGTKKGESDISAVADPNTGLAIYDTYGQNGWLQYGGTSLATPLVTAMYALAGTPGANDNPASYPYAHTNKLTDVTSGNNGTCGAPLCTATTGWDGPTGLGTPLGVSGLTGGTTTPPTTVTVANPGNQSGVVGTAASLPNSASGGTAPYTWTATGLPTGLSINSSTGTVSGTPSAAGTYNVTLTAKDANGVTGTASFTWTITAAGTTTVTVANPGNQSGVVGTAASLPNSASGGTAPYTWTATGLPTGLSINSSTGTVSGTPSAAGTYNVTLTAKDANGVTGTASFTWTITAAGGGTATVTVTNPGTLYDYTGDRISGYIKATDSKGLPLTFSATGLPTGLRISSTGLISGTITQYGFFNVTATATDSQGAHGSASFSWVVYLSPYGYYGGHAA